MSVLTQFFLGGQFLHAILSSTCFSPAPSLPMSGASCPTTSPWTQGPPCISPTRILATYIHQISLMKRGDYERSCQRHNCRNPKTPTHARKASLTECIPAGTAVLTALWYHHPPSSQVLILGGCLPGSEVSPVS